MFVRELKMQRTIYMPATDRRVSIGQYVTAIRLAKANPDVVFKEGLTCWWPCTGREIVKQFWDGVQSRINDAIPYSDRGRGAGRRLERAPNGAERKVS